VKHYRQIIERFDAVARANLETPTGDSDLCRATGVERRTLARAFRAIHGTTPKRYLQTLRLAEARRVLSSNGDKATTVTEVATRFGFRELGRFAVKYRQEFGESPSDTLRRSAVANQSA
jgi:transcriptional regulator GlxA family with amidase domain